MEHIVDSPRECPFLFRDRYGFADGCDFDATGCYDEDNFPEDCPLKNGDITVKLNKEEK